MTENKNYRFTFKALKKKIDDYIDYEIDQKCSYTKKLRKT